MSETGTQETTHEISVSAPAAVAYRMVAEVENWPHVFPPSVWVEVVEREADQERIRIWATANSDAKTWTSRRWLDPDNLRIDFRQEVSSPPVASMGGAWVVEPVAGDRCRVRLLHDYRAVGDDPADLDWIAKAVDRNSRSELDALKSKAEMAAAEDERMLSFTDSVRVEGAAKDLFEFIDRADAWPRRLPHVAEVSLHEDSPGLQKLRMDTRAKDGSTHTTESVRVCFPDHRIVYKQTTLPDLMSLHTGRWTFEEDETGTTAVSQHTVVVNTDAISEVLGPDADLARARTLIRETLGANSRTTLQHAKEFAERAD